MTQAQRKRQHTWFSWGVLPLQGVWGDVLFLVKCDILHRAEDHLGRKWCLFAPLLIESNTFLRYFPLWETHMTSAARCEMFPKLKRELFPKFFLSAHVFYEVGDDRVHSLWPLPPFSHQQKHPAFSGPGQAAEILRQSHIRSWHVSSTAKCQRRTFVLNFRHRDCNSHARHHHTVWATGR